MSLMKLSRVSLADTWEEDVMIVYREGWGEM